nr:hypothetical protein GCM10020093_104340 [Planobispora longispora]
MAVLETSKAADEIEAVASGLLVHAAAKDTWITPGAVLARILSEGAAASGAHAPAGDSAESAAASGAVRRSVIRAAGGAAAGAPAGAADS